MNTTAKHSKTGQQGKENVIQGNRTQNPTFPFVINTNPPIKRRLGRINIQMPQILLHNRIQHLPLRTRRHTDLLCRPRILIRIPVRRVDLLGMSVVEGDAAFVFGGDVGGGGGGGAVGVGGARVHEGFVEVLVEVFVLFLLGQFVGGTGGGERGEGGPRSCYFRSGCGSRIRRGR